MDIIESLQNLSPVVSIALIGYLIIKEILKSENKRTNKDDQKQDVEIAEIKTKLELLMGNHIPHLEKRMERTEEKIDKIMDILLKK